MRSTYDNLDVQPLRKLERAAYAAVLVQNAAFCRSDQLQISSTNLSFGFNAVNKASNWSKVGLGCPTYALLFKIVSRDSADCISASPQERTIAAKHKNLIPPLVLERTPQNHRRNTPLELS